MQCPARGSKEGLSADRLYLRAANEKCGRVGGRGRRVCQVPVPELHAASFKPLYNWVEGFDRSEKVLVASFRGMRSNSHKFSTSQLGKHAEVCRQGKTVDMFNL